MKNKYLNILAALMISNLVCVPFALAMSSQNYEITQDSINFAGSDDGKSTNYTLQDTAGEVGSGPMDSESYSIEGGFRQNDNESPYLSFNVAAASQSSKVAYTAFASTTVTLSSAPIVVAGDYIAVTENEGIGQKVAVGKVYQVAGNTVTVDFWSGDFATMSSSPVGIDDYAYKLSGNTLDLGVLSSVQVNTGLSFYDVTTSAKNGYTVSLYGNQSFQTSAGASLSNVSDGAVSVGAGEYGIRTTGDDISTSTSDMAVLTTPMVIASSSIRSELKRSATIYKASGNNFLMAGRYAQGVVYIATLNF